MINAENDMMMRKIVTKILPGLLLFVLLAVDVSAQDNATREARLNVVTDISIFAEQGLAFGTITRGQNKQVNPDDGTVTRGSNFETLAHYLEWGNAMGRPRATRDASTLSSRID